MRATGSGYAPRQLHARRGLRSPTCSSACLAMASTRHLLAAVLIGLAPGLLAVDWPTNVVAVTDSETNAECNGANVDDAATSQECCTGVDAGTCDGYEGADIREGLEACQAAGGCVLKLPCNATFANAENSITSEA